MWFYLHFSTYTTWSAIQLMPLNVYESQSDLLTLHFKKNDTDMVLNFHNE